MASLRRALMTVLAVLFLIEAWIWDAFATLGHWLARILHLSRLVDALRGLIARLPPPVTLALFVIPIIVLLPFKLAALWLIARGHFVWGGTVFFAAKTVSVGTSALLFDLCREQLLSMPWFVRVYRLVLAVRAWAHDLVAPLRARIHVLRLKLRSYIGGGRFGRRILALRARIMGRATR